MLKKVDIFKQIFSPRKQTGDKNQTMGKFCKQIFDKINKNK